VVVYRGSGDAWEVVQVIGGAGASDGQLDQPRGLRFSACGAMICVADSLNARASLFRVGDGAFVRHIATGLHRPMDVEEVEGGWLVACRASHSVEFVGTGGGRWSCVAPGSSGPVALHCPTSLAMAPGVGLITRGTSHIHMFTTQDAVAISAMSRMRVAWMVGVARGVRRVTLLRRQL